MDVAASTSRSWPLLAVSMRRSVGASRPMHALLATVRATRSSRTRPVDTILGPGCGRAGSSSCRTHGGLRTAGHQVARPAADLRFGLQVTPGGLQASAASCGPRRSEPAYEQLRGARSRTLPWSRPMQTGWRCLAPARPLSCGRPLQESRDDDRLRHLRGPRIRPRASSGPGSRTLETACLVQQNRVGKSTAVTGNGRTPSACLQHLTSTVPRICWRTHPHCGWAGQVQDFPLQAGLDNCATGATAGGLERPRSGHPPAVRLLARLMPADRQPSPPLDDAERFVRAHLAIEIPRHLHLSLATRRSTPQQLEVRLEQAIRPEPSSSARCAAATSTRKGADTQQVLASVGDDSPHASATSTCPRLFATMLHRPPTPSSPTHCGLPPRAPRRGACAGSGSPMLTRDRARRLTACVRRATETLPSRLGPPACLSTRSTA